MGSEEHMASKMENTKKVIEEVNAQFKNPVVFYSLLAMNSLSFPIHNTDVAAGFDVFCVRLYSGYVPQILT